MCLILLQVHERDLLTLNISDVRVIRAPTEEPASEDHDLENVYHFFGKKVFLNGLEQ